MVLYRILRERVCGSNGITIQRLGYRRPAEKQAARGRFSKQVNGGKGLVFIRMEGKKSVPQRNHHPSIVLSIVLSIKGP
jgi:hypothetical protein